jgi:DNA-binding MarR family transcriptional regulator
MVPLLNRLTAEGLQRRRLTQPRARLILTLADAGPLIMTELARALDITPRGVTTLVDGLQGQGLVSRTNRPGDRRATVVSLNAEGQQIVDDMRAGYRRFAGDVLAGCEPHDLAVTLRLLSQVRANLEKRRTAGSP